MSADNFDWSSDNPSLVLATQMAVAVFENERGEIAIRQQADASWQEEDSWVYFTKDRAVTVARAILDVAGIDLANVQPARNVNAVEPAKAPGYGSDTVTITDPIQRMARFQVKLAAALGSGGWQTIDTAMHPSAPGYADALAKCKAAAAAIGKGWPRAWPNLESEQGNVSPLRAA